ncbi:glycosyltransferase domain-containing protein [Cyclobacterium plantarum]|uniref:DUF616 domain-containing protein n=1 Tax=Cyclobacterium plantarum TaxID=2716263 RepID=A0ABX0H492_9BACT|nr:glycosyltransferase domain-containing protein [Cyclobacterium plantarum]NHE56245.1 DUF616 domain-containing protein [Cyclobacterium plantarum]
MKIAVYTAIFGGKDYLLDPINFKKNVNYKVDYFCFTDNLKLISNVYTIIYINPSINSTVKKSRFIKIKGSKELIEYDYVIWHDGNIQINADKIEVLIEDLGNNFLAVFRHPYRDNIFDESKACIKLRKEDFFIIIFQLLVYMWKGVSTEGKLFETGIFVKKNNFKEEFFNLWWDNVKKYSCRDQISLSYVVENTNEKLSLLDGEGKNNPYSTYHPHIYNTIGKKLFCHKIEIKIFGFFVELFKVFQKGLIRKFLFFDK